MAASPPSTYRTREHKLVIHLYRSFRLPVAFAPGSASLNRDMQSDLVRTIQQHQTDFLTRISQLRHNYTNYLKLIAETDEKTNARGTFRSSVGWYCDHQPVYYERFKQLLFDIRELLPCLPPSTLDIPDHGLVESLQRFEAEASAVIVNPVRDMAYKVLTRTLVGEGLLTEQAMNVYLNLKDADFTRQSFSKVIARVISSRNRLYFRKNLGDDLLASNINVLQGQLDGHLSHLMGLLTGRDMTNFVQASLRGIRHGFLPVIMRQAIAELAELDQFRPRIYGHSLFKEQISLKDLVLHNLLVAPGYLAECVDAIEPLTHAFDPADPANGDPELVELRVIQAIERALDRLDQFGMGIRGLPEQELDLKIKWLRTQFAAGIDACLELLTHYDGIFDKVDEAIRPLMGLISFDSGGQSEFYSRWFPGLNSILHRELHIGSYILALEQLASRLEVNEERGSALKRNLATWVQPEILAQLQLDNPHILRFISGDLLDVLAWSYQFLDALRQAPDWFHELEARIYGDIEQKKTQAHRIIDAGKRQST